MAGIKEHLMSDHRDQSFHYDAVSFDRYVRTFNRDLLIWIGVFSSLLIGLIVVVSLDYTNSRKLNSAIHSLRLDKSENALLSDVSVLNFALAAEDLESAGYNSLIASLAGLNGGTFTTKAGDVLNGTNLWAIARQLGGEETAHASALRNAIIPGLCASVSTANRAKCKPIDKCQYSFGLTTTNTQSSYAAAFNLAMVMEQVGEGAYVQAMGLIKDADLRVIAAGILSVESEHTAFFRYVSGISPSPVTVVPPLSINQVLCAAAPFVTNADTCPPWNTRKC